MSEMVAGRELDAKIEVEIMGRPGAWHDRVRINDKWVDIVTWVPDYSSPENPPAGSYAGSKPQPYSTSIAAAWQVVEKLEADSYAFYKFHSEVPSLHMYSAEEAAHAICLAALKACASSIPTEGETE